MSRNCGINAVLRPSCVEYPHDQISGRNLQPFTLVSEPFRIDASTDDDAIFRARFSPRHRDSMLVNPLGLDLSGITMGGELVIGSRLGELAFWTEAPLTVGPLNASFEGVPLFANSGIRLHGDVTFGPSDIRVSDLRAILETPSDTLLYADAVAIINLEDRLIDSAAEGSNVHIVSSPAAVELWPRPRYSSRFCHFQWSRSL